MTADKNSLIDEVLSRNREILDDIERLFLKNPDTIDLVPWSLLKQLPFTEKYKIGEGVYCRRVENKLKPSSIFIYVEFAIESTLPPHKHDCYEKYTVISGHLAEKGFNGVIEPYKEHSFRAITDVILMVEFFK